MKLGNDREHKIQIFQSSLYSKIQKLFSAKHSLVFLNRYDEFFAVTNTLTLDDHIYIQEKLTKLFHNTISMFIGSGNTPFDANVNAFEYEQNRILLNNIHNIYGYIDNIKKPNTTIMHFDIEGLTIKRKKQSPYEISLLIFKLYYAISDFLLTNNALTFFLGGDNFMTLAGDDYKNSAKTCIEMIKHKYGVTLNCGIGHGITSRIAAKHATQSLDMIRSIRNSGKKKPILYEI